jgi:hypothetical protein
MWQNIDRDLPSALGKYVHWRFPSLIGGPTRFTDCAHAMAESAEHRTTKSKIPLRDIALRHITASMHWVYIVQTNVMSRRR